jgi:hypothetical protein
MINFEGGRKVMDKKKKKTEQLDTNRNAAKNILSH